MTLPHGDNERKGSGPRKLRTFLAVNLPLPVVRRIADEVTALKGPVAAAGLRVAWVPAANLHLTIKFLGQVPEPAIEAIRDLLRGELPALAPFEAEAGGLGAFPSSEHARILWAGIKPSTPLSALQERVEGWMERLGFPREQRAFHPHLTIGRVSSGHGSIASILDERNAMVFGAGRISELVVYESRTLRSGAEYHALCRIPLGEKAKP
jgi:2'-5' RNA ligase